jgi:hypothetical protein
MKFLLAIILHFFAQSDHAVCLMVVLFTEVIYLSNYVFGVNKFFTDERKA